MGLLKRKVVHSLLGDVVAFDPKQVPDKYCRIYEPAGHSSDSSPISSLQWADLRAVMQARTREGRMPVAGLLGVAL